MATKQIKPKIKDREATEERLLLAAEQVFSKFGFKGATTRMIAKKADINLALINRYFDGKYGLLLKVLENKKKRFNEGELPYAPKDNLIDECVAFALVRFDNMTQDTHFFKIIMVQFLTDPKFLKKFQESLIDFESMPGFERRLADLHQQGKFPKFESTQKVFDVINNHICSTILFDIVIFKEIEISKHRKLVEEFVRTYCQGLLA